MDLVGLLPFIRLLAVCSGKFNTGSFYTIQYILSSLGVMAAQGTPFGV